MMARASILLYPMRRWRKHDHGSAEDDQDKQDARDSEGAERTQQTIGEFLHSLAAMDGIGIKRRSFRLAGGRRQLFHSGHSFLFLPL